MKLRCYDATTLRTRIEFAKNILPYGNAESPARNRLVLSYANREALLRCLFCALRFSVGQLLLYVFQPGLLGARCWRRDVALLKPDLRSGSEPLVLCASPTADGLAQLLHFHRHDEDILRAELRFSQDLRFHQHLLHAFSRSRGEDDDSLICLAKHVVQLGLEPDGAFRRILLVNGEQNLQLTQHSQLLRRVAVRHRPRTPLASGLQSLPLGFLLRRVGTPAQHRHGHHGEVDGHVLEALRHRGSIRAPSKPPNELTESRETAEPPPEEPSAVEEEAQAAKWRGDLFLEGRHLLLAHLGLAAGLWFLLAILRRLGLLEPLETQAPRRNHPRAQAVHDGWGKQQDEEQEGARGSPHGRRLLQRSKC
mmetsp:Transcript_6411/g.24884  ORF Transcript_6411/g.24884 Transcript_6411/m.24884 type:complete len:365 (-) Transcript_6411:78-1172(-)